MIAPASPDCGCRQNGILDFPERMDTGDYLLECSDCHLRQRVMVKVVAKTRCRNCDGRGHTGKPMVTLLGSVIPTRTCRYCNGSGEFYK